MTTHVAVFELFVYFVIISQYATKLYHDNYKIKPNFFYLDNVFQNKNTNIH